MCIAAGGKGMCAMMAPLAGAGAGAGAAGGGVQRLAIEMPGGVSLAGACGVPLGTRGTGVTGAAAAATAAAAGG